MQIDHVVFNVRDRMDEAVEAFVRLGFQVSGRGFHTLGSINHTIALEKGYLELLGYPAGSPPPKRPELVARPVGWMATVLATDDADRTRGRLLGRGLAARPVQQFSRPVALPDGTRAEARFRVTRLEPDAVPGTWYYYCQHLTPELVWRPEWCSHPNDATAVAGVDMEVANIREAAVLHACALDCDDPPVVDDSFLLEAGACALRVRGGADGARMSGVTIAVRSIEAVHSRLARLGVPFEVAADGLRVDPSALLGATLQFVNAAQ